MTNLDFGLWLTVMGMGTVFGLLLVLMLVLQLLGRLDRKPVEPAATGPSGLVIDPGGLTEDELAAVTVAVVAHARAQRHLAAPDLGVVEAGRSPLVSGWVSTARSIQHQRRSRG